MYEEEIIQPDEIVVCIATGHQLKDPIATIGYHTEGVDKEVDSKFKSFGIMERKFANKPLKVQKIIEEVIDIITSS